MTRRPYTPRAYAPLVDAFLHAHPRCALFAGMGTGKTVMVLSHLDFLWHDMGDHRLTLVVAPKQVVDRVWKKESESWAHLRLKVVNISGDKNQRAAALEEKAQVYCIGYDNLQWLRKHFKDQRKPWPFKRVVADESTRLKSFRTRQGGARASALGEVAWIAVEEVILLTGTPSPNGLKDLWGQAWFLDRGKRLGASYGGLGGFEQRWFGWRKVTDAVTHKPGLEPVIFPHAQEEIMGLISDLCLTVDAKDWFDLKEPIVNTIEVDLPPTARRHYNEMQRELFTVLKDGNEIEAMGAGPKSMKCRQFAAGAAYLEDGVQWREVHTEKIEALRSIVEEAAGAPVLVSYYFKSDLARLQAAFPQGRTLATKNAEADWNAGKLPLLFVHPKSAGHGLSLQHGGNILVYFTFDWNLEEHQQILERIGPTRQAQSGYDRPVFVHYIVARNTVDLAVRARLGGKVSVQQALLDYMNRSKG